MKVSWDDDIPNIWKIIKLMFQTTNQICIAIENGPVEIVDFPSYKMGGSFHSFLYLYQRVNPIKSH